MKSGGNRLGLRRCRTASHCRGVCGQKALKHPTFIGEC